MGECNQDTGNGLGGLEGVEVEAIASQKRNLTLLVVVLCVVAAA